MQQTYQASMRATLSLLFLSTLILFRGSAAFASGPVVSQYMTDINGGWLLVGDQMEYTVVIENQGSDPIKRPQFTEPIPFGTRYVSGSSIVNDVSVSDDQDSDEMSYDQDEARLVFAGGDLLPGDKHVIVFRVELVGSDFFLTSAGSPAQLHRLNRSTGAIIHSRSLPGQSQVTALTLTRNGEYILGIDSSKDAVFKYNLWQDKFTQLDPLGLGDVQVPCMDFNGGYELIGIDANSDQLFKVDIHTGKGTVLHPLRLDANTNLNVSGGGCAFDADGMLHVVSENPDGAGSLLYVVDVATGYGQRVNSVSQSQVFTGLGLDLDGALYASSKTSNGLYRLSTSGSEAASVGSFGQAHAEGELVSASSQRLRIMGRVQYSDGNGNESTVNIEHVITGEAPTTPPPKSSGDLVLEMDVDTDGDGIYDDNGSAVQAGDVIDYRIKYDNSGFGAADIANLDIDIQTPSGASYVRRSMRAQPYNNFADEDKYPGTPRSDRVGDDSGNYDKASDRPYFRPKNVAGGQSGMVKFKLFVNNNTNVDSINTLVTIRADGGSPITVQASNAVSNSGGLNAGATTEYHLIFDSSFSMGYDLNGRRKIDIAIDAVKSAINAVLTEGVSVMSVRVYGSEASTSIRSSCQDSKRIIDSVPLNAQQFHGSLDQLTPNGYTPIALSLDRVREEIAQANPNRNHEITLISDGQESCGGDPVLAAQQLVEAARVNGVEVIINTIGFDIDNLSAAKEELEAIAEVTGGRFFNASSLF